MSNFKIQSGQRVVFIGNSITDCGRRQEFAPLGNGYVHMVVNLSTAKYPGRKIEWINKGIGGDTVQGLVKRWTEDIVEEKPDWVSIAIGVNNVAREQTSGRILKECLKGFEASYRNILDRTREETDAELVMFEIFYIKEEDQLERNLNVEVYNEIIHRLAAEYNAILVPIHSAFRQAVSKRPDGALTMADGVHPLPVGHALIALTFLEVMGW